MQGREKAYCHLFNAKCDICPFNQKNGAIFGMEGKSHVMPEKYLLSREHLWIAASATDRVLVGIDDFLASALYHIRSVVHSGTHAEIASGKNCVWIIDIIGTICLQAPISGQIIATNNEIPYRPSLMKEHPYGWGWLFELLPQPEWQEGLMAAPAGRKFIDQSRSLLRDKIVTSYSLSHKEMVVADGGELLTTDLVEANPAFYLEMLLETIAETRRYRSR